MPVPNCSCELSEDNAKLPEPEAVAKLAVPVKVGDANGALRASAVVNVLL